MCLILILIFVGVGSWAGSATGGAAGPGTAQAAGTPIGYLLAAQNADGGFGAAPGSGSAQLYAGWAALGLAAAGDNPQDVSHDGHSAIGYIGGGLRGMGAFGEK